MEIIKTYNTRRSTRGSLLSIPRGTSGATPVKVSGGGGGGNKDSAKTDKKTSVADDGGNSDAESSTSTPVEGSTPGQSTQNSDSGAANSKTKTTPSASPKILTRRRASTRASSGVANCNSTEVEITPPVSPNKGLEKGKPKTTEKVDSVAPAISADQSPASNQSSVRSTRSSRRGSATATALAASNSPTITRRRYGRSAVVVHPQQERETIGGAAVSSTSKQVKKIDNNNQRVNSGDGAEENSGGTDDNTVAATTPAELKENRTNETISTGENVATEVSSVDRPSTTITVKEEPNDEPLSTTSSASETLPSQILEIEKSILASETLFNANSSDGDSINTVTVKEEENNTPESEPVVLEPGSQDSPLKDNTGKSSSNEAGENTDRNVDEGENGPQPISTIHFTVADNGNVYVSPGSPDDDSGVFVIIQTLLTLVLFCHAIFAFHFSKRISCRALI